MSRATKRYHRVRGNEEGPQLQIHSSAGSAAAYQAALFYIRVLHIKPHSILLCLTTQNTETLIVGEGHSTSWKWTPRTKAPPRHRKIEKAHSSSYILERYHYRCEESTQLQIYSRLCYVLQLQREQNAALSQQPSNLTDISLDALAKPSGYESSSLESIAFRTMRSTSGLAGRSQVPVPPYGTICDKTSSTMQIQSGCIHIMTTYDESLYSRR